MSSFPKEHDTLYFDKLVRTSKPEAVLSLIYASFYANINNLSQESIKAEIASRLKNAYSLIKKQGSGTYDGQITQFESQYTTGHEMAIWKNKNLELTDFAKLVATNKITIRDYFDVIWLNYIQPVNGKIVHPLYSILNYMIRSNINYIKKSEIGNTLGVRCDNESLTLLCNYLVGTSYFSFNDNVLTYIGESDIYTLSSKCNCTYLSENGYDRALNELSNDDKYQEYITSGFNTKKIERKFKNLSLNFNYNEEDLGKILLEMYNNSKDRTTAIHLFGIRYGKYITDNELNAEKIIKSSTLPDSYYQELRKGMRLSQYVAETRNSCFESNYSRYGKTINEIKAYNKIVYGVPGCGKSFYVDSILLNELGIDNKSSKVIRTTFFMDYTNTDFVGQILPKINGEDVKYEFNPGPFTLALKEALIDKSKPVALIIEELNRGNAASIFGDIFQLLDRDKNGNSIYDITNVNIQDYLNYEFNLKDNKIDRIYIPNNLYIIATMNTSDQNVYTLDNAFKRRWTFQRLKNTFKNHPYADYLIPTRSSNKTSWKNLVDSINDYIVSNIDSLMTEDKQIGVYFIQEEQLVKKDIKLSDKDLDDKIDQFSYKFFEYLWDDVDNLYPKRMFNNINTLDDLITKYKKDGLSVFREGIINNDDNK